MMTDKMMTERQARAWVDCTNDLIIHARRTNPELANSLQGIVGVRDVVEEYSHKEGVTVARICVEGAEPGGELEQWLTEQLDLPEGVYVKAERW